MPSTPADFTTEQLLDQLDNTVFTSFTVAQMIAELKYRLIPNDDESISNTEYRRGIRPTHIPTH